MGRVDLTVAPVVERSRLRDLLMDELDGAAVLLGRVSDLGEVLGCQGVHRRDGKPSFGAFRVCWQALDECHRRSRIEAEDLGDRLDLVCDGFGACVPARV